MNRFECHLKKGAAGTLIDRTVLLPFMGLKEWVKRSSEPNHFTWYYMAVVTKKSQLTFKLRSL